MQELDVVCASIKSAEYLFTQTRNILFNQIARELRILAWPRLFSRHPNLCTTNNTIYTTILTTTSAYNATQQELPHHPTAKAKRITHAWQANKLLRSVPRTFGFYHTWLTASATTLLSLGYADREEHAWWGLLPFQVMNDTSGRFQLQPFPVLLIIILQKNEK
jgi:hypothetical protein